MIAFQPAPPPRRPREARAPARTWLIPRGQSQLTTSKYEPHNDFFFDLTNSDPAKGGQRVATVLAYLTTPEEGGETVFPDGQPDGSTNGPEWSDCARGKLAVKAVRGDALLFYSLAPSGEPEASSLHGSCPTLKGKKYSMTKWSHVYPFGAGPQRRDAEGYNGCRDLHPDCQAYFSAGKCIHPAPRLFQGICEKSCGLCAPRGPGQARAWASRQAAPSLAPSVDLEALTSVPEVAGGEMPLWRLRDENLMAEILEARNSESPGGSSEDYEEDNS